jgi:methylglyoxal synthase
MSKKKAIALVAHDNKKRDLVDWASKNREVLSQFELYATGTTGKLLNEELDIQVNRLKSGPLGGDQQIGAMIAEEKVDFLVFFWDPLQPLPHDPDIKALLRIAAVYNLPIACNRSSADFIFSSPLIRENYNRTIDTFQDYLQRKVGQ